MSQAKNAETQPFRITFWGTRGTRTVSGDSYSNYGNDTICVEVQCGERHLIFDFGSGLNRLGQSMIQREIRNVDMFLSHAHYDHVEGIPFFPPFFQSDFIARFWSGRLKGIERTRDIVDGLMREPYFPIRQEKFLAKIIYQDISDYQSLSLGDKITVATTRLHHPGGATGYRVDFNGKSFAFITDTTHSPGHVDSELVLFLDNVDLFAYDCSYLDEEFPKFANFGHSTWQEAFRLGKASGAKSMLGFHHMPFRSDADLDNIARLLKSECENCAIAKDGMTIDL